MGGTSYVIIKNMNEVIIDGCSLSISDVVAVARHKLPVRLDPDAELRMQASREVVEFAVKKKQVKYGITTGFGKFCDVIISEEDNAQLQKNLIMSHACGQGEPFAPEIVRAMMVLRANALAVGNSGVRPMIVHRILQLINEDIVPIVPEKGSLGASGDLAPLAHIALVLIGMGEALYKGTRMAGALALAEAHVQPLVLEAKEGLALINGTQAMAALGVLSVYDALFLYRSATIASALSFQALRGITEALDPRIHELRRQKAQIEVAQDLRRLLEDSRLTSMASGTRVQDAYALRCIPQVHGACLAAIRHVWEIVSAELNAVTDNPLIFPYVLREGGDIISGGNFHGEPLALALDYLGIGASELANLSERRLERMVNPTLSEGLPAFLTINGGLNSGFMIVQYSAASLVSENKVLSHPASVDSIPSSANQEDHVSMGTIAARKARQIIDNARRVIAMELLAACQALDLRAIQLGFPSIVDSLSPATAQIYTIIRTVVRFSEQDRIMYPDIDAVVRLLSDEILPQTMERWSWNPEPVVAHEQ
ncbi:MAG TPA: histidine ammonia-lyase [Rectinema sp.]|jgi:histidine ammonia-lyase|nr:MAG: Histidine ammonia-lyase [Spirochaetes bacterium ADurb.Bin001]HPW02325.1 histidine ammonia-lyase [Rectinema sp.]HQN02934.1 histidine ammonia-lyase [Rectinema sp.]